MFPKKISSTSDIIRAFQNLNSRLDVISRMASSTRTKAHGSSVAFGKTPDSVVEIFRSFTESEEAPKKPFVASHIRHSLSMPQIDLFVKMHQEIEAENIEEKNSEYFQKLVGSRKNVSALPLKEVYVEKKQKISQVFAQDPMLDFLIIPSNDVDVAYNIYYKNLWNKEIVSLEVPPKKCLESELSDLKRLLKLSQKWSFEGALSLPTDFSSVWENLDEKKQAPLKRILVAFSSLSEKTIQSINLDAQGYSATHILENLRKTIRQTIKKTKELKTKPKKDWDCCDISYQFKYDLLAFIAWHLAPTKRELAKGSKCKNKAPENKVPVFSSASCHQIVVSLAVASCFCEYRFAEALSQVYQHLTGLSVLPMEPPVAKLFDDWTEEFKNSIMDSVVSTSEHSGNIRYDVCELLENDGIFITNDMQFRMTISNKAKGLYEEKTKIAYNEFLGKFNAGNYIKYCQKSLTAHLKSTTANKNHTLAELTKLLRKYAAAKLKMEVDFSQEQIDSAQLILLDEYIVSEKLITEDYMFTTTNVTHQGMCAILETLEKISLKNLETPIAIVTTEHLSNEATPSVLITL